MRILGNFMIWLAVVMSAIPASADSLVYIETSNQNGSVFGTLSLSTGAFQQIGPGLTDQGTGLVPQANGSLLTLGFDGTLEAINPTTGVEISIGATGLGDCSVPGVSTCGANSALGFGTVNGILYATDFSGNLYTVNPATGQATKIGSTGLTKVTFVPGLPGANGDWTGVDESLFSAGGKLYANEDFVTIDPTAPNPVVGVVLADAIYQVNTTTGLATMVASTLTPLNAFVDVNGTEYTFDGNLGETLSLNLTNGNTTLVNNYDPAAGLLSGAAPTPEPISLGMMIVGIAGLAVWKKQTRDRPRSRMS